MSKRTHTNITGKTGGGNIYYDERFALLYKVAKEQDISKEAVRRLKWMDHHAKTDNAAFTCRYFGISESCFWKWKNRFDRIGIRGLESRSRKPRNVRTPETDSDTIETIERLRRLFPCYGKEKIYELMGSPPGCSVSTVGRVIKRYNLFFRKRKKVFHSGQWKKKQRIKNIVLHHAPGGTYPDGYYHSSPVRKHLLH
jgi:transposase